MDYNSHRILVIIPVYCEEKIIGKVISKFSNRFVDEICIVLDYPSTTIRNEIKNSAALIDVPLHLIENLKRRGIGFAIRLGIQYALENAFDIIIVMAGNDKDDPREIPRFLDAITHYNCDYIQGSRFAPGGNPVRTPMLRGIFIRLYPLLWSILTKVPCTDVTNGFRAYKSEIFRDKRINIWQDWLDSYELEYYLHYKVLTLGYKTGEVAVSKIYQYRNKGGYSKINPIRDFWNILSPLFYLALGVRT